MKTNLKIDPETGEILPQSEMTVSADKAPAVTIDVSKVAEFHDNPIGLAKIIADQANLMVFDVSTEKGRKALNSHAATIIRCITPAANESKRLADQAKQVVKQDQDFRRIFDEKVRAIAAEVRKPLTEWEEAEAYEKELQVEAEKKRQAEEQYQKDWQEAIDYDELFTLRREKAQREAEEAAFLRDADIAAKKAYAKEHADGYQILFPDMRVLLELSIEEFKATVISRVEKQKVIDAEKEESLSLKIKQELLDQQAEKDRKALESRILSQTELAKSMLTPVDVVFTVEQVLAESVRLAHLLVSELNELEADAYQKYSVKLAEYAEKMEVAAKLAGEELARRQALSVSTDPDDIIRAEIKDLRDQAKHIYQSAQYCDNGTTRRAEESQAQALNIKVSKLEKELDIQIRIKANIALAARWLDENVDLLTLDAKEVTAESERLFDLITENTSFAEVNSYSAHAKQLMNLADEIIAIKPISAAKYIPPSKTGWDDPIEVNCGVISDKAEFNPVIESQCVDTVVNAEQSYMSKDKVRILKAVMSEFGCSAGDAESKIIAAFFKPALAGDLF